MPHSQLSCHTGIDLVKIEVLQKGINMGSLLPFFLKGGQNRYFFKLRE